MKECTKEELRNVGSEIGRLVIKSLISRLREWWRYDRPHAKHKRLTESD